MGRPRDREIVLSETEQKSLIECVRSRSAPYGLVRRARIVLASASGRSNTEIARELAISVPSVCLWRNRFLAQGLVGLYGEQRPGRPRSHDDEAVAALLTTVLQSRPTSGTHWTVRSAAAAAASPKARCNAISGYSGCNLIGRAISSFPRIHSLSRRCATLSGYTSIRLTMPWSSASMRRAKFRRWNERSQCCRWVSAMPTVSRTTTSAMAPRPCSPLSISPTAGS